MVETNVNPHLAKWAHLKPNQHCSLLIDDGDQEWVNSLGQLHRVDENGIQDGPAVIWKDGRQIWWLNDKLHRLDGPAVTYPNGGQGYYLDDVWMSQEEWSRDPRVIQHHAQTQELAEQWLTYL